MYTEEDAKTKWCHRAPTGLLGHPHAMCIGTACMAWRFLPQMWRHTSAAPGQGAPTTWDEPKEINGYGRKGMKLPHVGYCGLAGAPQ
jgi:hypothetical protein